MFDNVFAGKRTVIAALAAALGIGCAATGSFADEIADFYSGKRMKIIAGSSAGGGYDTYARLVERHLGRFIPGHPSLVTQNMVGAGGLVATNYVANVAPKDGTVIVATQRFVPLNEAMGKPGAKFESAELAWLGSLAQEAGVCAVAARTGVESFEDVFRHQYAMGSTGPNTTEAWPALFRNLMAAEFKLIRGYPGTAEIHLAIERGELDGVCQSWASFRELAGHRLEEGKIKPLVQVNLKPDPEMTAMGVPMISEFYDVEHLAAGRSLEDVKLFFKLSMVPLVMGRPYAMAADVPPERVRAVRAAFEAMAHDPKFLADAKRIGRVVEFVSGEEIQGLIAQMFATPKEKLAELLHLFKFEGPVEELKLEVLRHTGEVVKTKRGGREIVIDHEGKKVDASISGSRTEVTIDGKKAKRGAVKPGMSCTFVYSGPGTEAQELICEH